MHVSPCVGQGEHACLCESGFNYTCFGSDRCDPRERFPRGMLGLLVRIIHQWLLGEKLRENGQTKTAAGPKIGKTMFL